ncbi:MAG: alpha-glucuronidase family glycosyl hydrolase [candidate division KSB1 bacterium]|nr:alpha-glucuronidase family glycosyl hydrolase [candidate division KSB1 bacterium]
MKFFRIITATQVIVMLLSVSFCMAKDKNTAAPVGRWDFPAGTGQDGSAYNNPADLGDAMAYPLGNDQFCMKVMPDGKPITIKTNADSKLAIKAGTISLWVNSSYVHNYNLVDYDNGAFTLRSYRGYLQARFKGETSFKFSGTVMNDKWHKYVMREDAFYPHDNAMISNNVWHHFAVTFDYVNKRFIGWRDGELIAVIDLSESDVEALKTQDLGKIVIAEEFTGFIDDIRIYDEIFEIADVQRIYNATTSIYKSRQDIIKPPKDLYVYSFNESDKELYDAWLREKPDNTVNPFKFKHIVIQGQNSTIYTAGQELTAAIHQKPELEVISSPAKEGNIILGTPSESKIISEMAAVLELDKIVHDGYVIKTVDYHGSLCIFVAANKPAGVVFGAFDLIRKINFEKDLDKLDILSNPKVEIRLIGHWDWFRGFASDGWHAKEINSFKWESNRYNSIYSWEDLRTGNTKLIKDWARLLASAGWNAVCPTEINWQFQNNFLEHLDEVELLAEIFRNYGITLYWTPNYLLALEKATADTLYAHVPDFGGYLLKLGSEGQLGNPFPPMVNQIADNLLPYGGQALVRGFVYGKHRYKHLTPVYRNTMQYDIYVPNDGTYRENVTIVGKANPLDWDLSAPISPLDGALRETAYGTEMVVAKSWPASWIEKWKWWMDYDNYRNGPGSYNKNEIKCLLGVSMISPSPAWTSNPLNMANYYGLGRLGWNPDISVDQIYDEWIKLTFNKDPKVAKTVKDILYLSDNVLKNLYLYRGYRGVWFDTSEDNLVESKTPHILNKKGFGIVNTKAQKKELEQYAPQLRSVFADPVKTEAFLPYFHFVEYDYKLTNGRTLIEDMYANLDDAVAGTKQMLKLWNQLDGHINQRQFDYTRNHLKDYIDIAESRRRQMNEIFEHLTGYEYSDVID